MSSKTTRTGELGERLEHRTEGHTATDVDPVADGHRCPRRSSLRGDRLHQRGLADAGVPTDEQHPGRGRRSLPDRRQKRTTPGELVVPAQRGFDLGTDEATPYCPSTSTWISS
jgi:hypothetical protein